VISCRDIYFVHFIHSISFIGKTKKARAPADTAATWDHYTIGSTWKFGKIQKINLTAICYITVL